MTGDGGNVIFSNFFSLITKDVNVVSLVGKKLLLTMRCKLVSA